MLRIFSIFLTLTLLLVPSVFAGEKAPQKLVDYVNAKLVNFGSDPVILEAVKAENAKGKTLAQIKDEDAKWMAFAGIDNFMQTLMENPCAKRLMTIKQETKFFSEIFVMDNQGANVCMTDKTSDYWQGDEEKFIESFKGGKGGINISEVKFDDSSQAYLVQASVPVMDGGKAIGAITFGIDIDNFK